MSVSIEALRVVADAAILRGLDLGPRDVYEIALVVDQVHERLGCDRRTAAELVLKLMR